MLIFKRVVGWLSLLLLIGSFYTLGRAVYLMTNPFLNGGKVIVDYRWDPQGLSKQIGADWDKTDPPSNLVSNISGYIRGERLTYIGVGAVAEALENLDYIKRLYSSEDLFPVAILDVKGNVLAASPARMRSFRTDAVFGTAEWKTQFVESVSRQVETINPDIPLTIAPVINQAGKQVAFLAAPGVPKPLYQIPASMNLPTPQQLVVLAAQSVGLFLASWLLMVTWTAMDASWRGTNGFAWGFLVLITHWIGWLAFVLARPSAPASCPNCSSSVLAKFLRCPSCGFALPRKCSICNMYLKPGWLFCPACSASGAGMVAQGNGKVTTASAVERQAASRSETSGSGKMTVQVSDALTGNPLPRSRVTVDGTALTGLTDHLGSYTIGLLPDGAMHVLIACEGYAEQKLRVDHHPHGSLVRIALDPLPGSISVSVTSFEDGEPLANVRIFADSEKLDCETLSAVGGTAELQQVTPGFYTLVAELDGYEQQTRLSEVLPGKHSSVAFLLSRMPLAVSQTEEMQ